MSMYCQVRVLVSYFLSVVNTSLDIVGTPREHRLVYVLSGLGSGKLFSVLLLSRSSLLH
jgi:hypothetical protein